MAKTPPTWIRGSIVAELFDGAPVALGEIAVHAEAVLMTR